MRSVAFVVFLFPVVISLLFGGLVLGEVLGEPGRELNMWPFDLSKAVVVKTEALSINGLLSEYQVSEKIEIQVSITDEFFDCGDLYITIYDLTTSPKQVVTQSGYFSQCFGKNNLPLPINDQFSEEIDNPGNYEITIEMNDKNYKKTITASEKFKIK